MKLHFEFSIIGCIIIVKTTYLYIVNNEIVTYGNSPQKIDQSLALIEP